MIILIIVTIIIIIIKVKHAGCKNGVDQCKATHSKTQTFRTVRNQIFKRRRKYRRH
jgi:hypothetical protein